MSGIRLDLGNIVVENFARVGNDEEVWLGTCHIYGVPYHVQAIKIRESGWKQIEATDDPYGRLDDLYKVYEFTPETTKLPGMEGDYVLLIHPHGM